MSWWPWRKTTSLGFVRGIECPDPNKVAGAARELIENMTASNAATGFGSIHNDAGEPIFVIAIANGTLAIELYHAMKKLNRRG